MKACIVQTGRVSMTTFGGQQFYDIEYGDTFYYGSVLEVNDSYVVFKNGLNIYVIESKCFQPVSLREFKKELTSSK